MAQLALVQALGTALIHANSGLLDNLDILKVSTLPPEFPIPKSREVRPDFTLAKIIIHKLDRC